MPAVWQADSSWPACCRDDVTGWIVKLSTVSEIVEQWLMVQNMWMYMEAVFSGGDIVKQLPAEAKRFQNIDKSFMKVDVQLLLALHTGPCFFVLQQAELYEGCLIST